LLGRDPSEAANLFIKEYLDAIKALTGAEIHGVSPSQGGCVIADQES